MNSQSSMQPFHYDAVIREDEIRVVEILPGSGDEAIRCLLKTEPREEIEDTYDAISYVWGDPNTTTTIECCGRSLSITISLESALRTIRNKNPTASHRVWADAICINQESHEEKNHQVKQMGKVYKCAKRVFAWLGYDEGGIASSCFDLIREWNVYLDEQLLIHEHINDIPSFDPPNSNYSYVERGLQLRSLMNRTWFSRVWVVQEAGNAKECLLLWGDQTMDFAELMEFACFCTNKSSVITLMGDDDHDLEFWRIVFTCVYRTYHEGTSWTTTKPLIRSLYEKHRGKNSLLLDVLAVGRMLSAADGRDHIFAFRGNSLAENLMIEPDYDREEKDLYFDMVSALLQNKREAPFVLCFVQHATADEVDGTDGPSWIPKWRQSANSKSLFFTIGNTGVFHRAGGKVENLSYEIFRHPHTGDRLTIQGLFFDEVMWISDGILERSNFALSPVLWDAERRQSKTPYIDQLWNQVCKARGKRGAQTELTIGAEFSDEFALTLVTGYFKNRSVKPKEHRRTFRPYLQALRHLYADGGGALQPLQLSRQELCDASRYEVATRNCSHRRLAITKSGRCSLVPKFTGKGDLCAVFLGMVTPFVLRPAARRGKDGDAFYHLVGEAYIHGVMTGELLSEDTQRTGITLV